MYTEFPYRFHKINKIIFRAVSIALIIAHFSLVCQHDMSFAQSAGSTSSLQQGNNYATNNNSNGILEFIAPDSFTGQGQLNIPIAIPSGRRDIKPPLSITYNSSTGNGIMGVGWSLGISTISRSLRKGVPKYSSSDTFTVDKQQDLVNIGGNEYRPAIEGGFVKYIFNVTSWQAIDKTGTTYYFGSSGSSQISTVQGGIYSWSLDKIIDTKGNYLTISYRKDQNVLYPQNISYTGNQNTEVLPQFQINFTYETRPDYFTSYIIGDLTQVNSRLTNIAIYFNSTLVRKYVFEYIQSPLTAKSLLSKVTEFGADGTTSNPPVTFTYRANQGGWSADQSQWHTPGSNPPVAFSDMNGDGISDFIDIKGNVYLGSKTGFSQSANWNSVPLSFGGYDTGIRFVDLNGDGIPDSLQNYAYNTQIIPTSPMSFSFSRDSYIFKYNDSTNSQWVKSSQWNFLKGASHYNFAAPNTPDISYVDTDNGGVRFADLNGDGLNDLSIARSSTIRRGLVCGFGGCIDTGIVYSESAFVDTYINTGNGWQEDSRWNIPEGYYSNLIPAVEGDGGIRLVDLNGDGLTDVLIARDGYKAVYINNGRGWARNDSWNIPDGDFSGTFSNSGGTQLLAAGRVLVDINGDGLPDLVIALNGYHAVYINTGHGWKRDDSFNIPDGNFNDNTAFYVLERNQGRNLIDLDGDGVVDLCVDHGGYKAAYLNRTGTPDILINVSNGLGGSTNIEYAPSTGYDNYYPNTKLGRLPFPVQVVSKITTDDGQGNTYSTTYSYQGGCYVTSPAREFRGFSCVKTTDVDGNYTESFFLQDDIYKGRLLKQKISDSSGNLLGETDNIWKTAQPYTGVNFPYLAQSDQFVYDGTNYKQTETKYEYDNYGNLTKVTNLGDLSVIGDENSQINEYVYNTDNWIIGLPKHSYTLDSSGNKALEKWFYYDTNPNITDLPVKGLLTKQENWLYNPVSLKEDKTAAQYAYDQFGNPISATDALGRTSTTAYDTVCYDLPVRLTNALGQSIKTVYYGINEPNNDTISGFGLPGQVKSSQGLNNQKSYNIYDVLGRVIKVVGPNDTEVNPGVVYEYNFSLRPIKITKRIKADYNSPPQYLSNFQFTDGLNRAIETKSPAKDGISGQNRQIVSGLVTYNSRGQVKEKYLPYFVSASEDFVIPAYNTPHSSYNYDSLGRLIQAANPDLSYSTTSYSLCKKTVTDENSHSKTEYVDAYGRIIKVEEYNGSQIYTTRYEYDTLGNLIQTTDNQNNITQIWYDSLGRKVKMNDPDMGIWLYEYDKAGNLTKQTDAKLQVLEFVYDSINRLTQRKANSSTIVSYNYDNSGKQNCIGRLSDITDQSGSTSFYYDNLGREINSVKTVDGASYAVERAYDALERLVTLKYPDNSIVKYEYSPQGITKVTDLAASCDYVSDIDYSPTGQITRIKYGNSTQTDYSYDPNTLRLTNLTTQSPFGSIQDLNYQFDKIGNLTQLIDYINTASQSFLYDDLNRLVNATGDYGRFNYTYDSIGNMLFKENTNLSYGQGGKLPHAVTQYGNTTINYDASGNMITKGGLQLAYDAENRLIKTENKSLVPVPQTITVNLTLNPGWNFISLPVIPADSKISSILSPISGNFDQVSRYNCTTKKFEHYVGNSKYDQFNTLDYGKGYEIYISGSSLVSLNVAGTLPLSNSVALSSGCNLAFVPNNKEIPVETALSPLKLDVTYSKVLYYNSTKGAFQEYSSAKKEFTTLKPGSAYCLYCPNATTWPITNAPLSNSATFVYDGDGGRVKKVTATGSTTYIGSLFEKDSSGKISKNIFAGSVRICAVDSAGNKSFFHSDHLGSSNAITDSLGQQTGLTEFTPYGLVSRQSGSFEPKYKFTGKELDNTGLYFYGSRYMDPQLGRFITADSIVQAPYDPQSLNRYSYCRNNPINYTDPTGHSWWGNFWKSIFKPLISFVAAAVTVFFMPSFAPMIAQYGFWSVAGTVGASAAGASAILDTGDGRKFINGFGHAFFDNILGMSPGVANFFSSLVTHTVLASGIFMALSSITMPATNAGPNYTKAENQGGDFAGYGKGVSGDIDLGGANGGSSANFIKSTVENSTSAKFGYTHQGMIASDVAFKGTPGPEQVFTALNIRHTAALVNINGVLSDSAVDISLLSPLKGAIYALPWTATCHQATFNTLMAGGMSAAGAFSTTLSHGTSSYVISTSLYGINGGYGVSGIVNAEMEKK